MQINGCTFDKRGLGESTQVGSANLTVLREPECGPFSMTASGRSWDFLGRMGAHRPETDLLPALEPLASPESQRQRFFLLVAGNLGEEATAVQSDPKRTLGASPRDELHRVALSDSDLTLSSTRTTSSSQTSFCVVAKRLFKKLSRDSNRSGGGTSSGGLEHRDRMLRLELHMVSSKMPIAVPCIL